MYFISRNVCYYVHRRYPSVPENGPRIPRVPSKSPNHSEREQVVCQVLQVRILATTSPILWTGGIKKDGISVDLTKIKAVTKWKFQLRLRRWEFSRISGLSKICTRLH